MFLIKIQVSDTGPLGLLFKKVPQCTPLTYGINEERFFNTFETGCKGSNPFILFANFVNKGICIQVQLLHRNEYVIIISCLHVFYEIGYMFNTYKYKMNIDYISNDSIHVYSSSNRQLCVYGKMCSNKINPMQN